MAKKPSRYTEARLYLAGGSVGLLMIVWSILALKDGAPTNTSADTDTSNTTGLTLDDGSTQATSVPTTATGTSGTTSVATSAPTAAPTTAPTSSSSSSSSSTTTHTRSRGS